MITKDKLSVVYLALLSLLTFSWSFAMGMVFKGEWNVPVHLQIVTTFVLITVCVMYIRVYGRPSKSSMRNR